jgi:hypothetical protein
MADENKPEFRAVYEDSERYGWVEQEELKWQAQWYSETSTNEDKYERGGWYATEAEALEAAKRGKATMEALRRMIGDE